MLRKVLLAGLTGLSLAAFAATPAKADRWVMVGQTTVGSNPDKDVFDIGGEEGRFNALKFKALGGRVAVAEVRVFYGNNTSEYLNVREHMRPGQFTPAYELKGHDRVIKRIEVLYQTETRFKDRVTFQIQGLRRTAAAPSNWVTLGTVTPSRTIDHDVIRVREGKGTFRTLRFHVTNRSIYLTDIRVTFGNGQQQVYNFNQHVNAGAWSAHLDLKGDRRVIDRIDIVYRKDSSMPGNARLTVQGQH
jgi:hypothetical protein